MKQRQIAYDFVLAIFILGIVSEFVVYLLN